MERCGIVGESDRRCVIVGGSDIGNYEFVRGHLRDDDFVIYCDCGLSHMDGLLAKPSLIVGDFDSHENPNLDVETIVLPTEKDDTDTVYAVKEAIKRGLTEFVLVGALGRRFDHTLGNLAILLMLDSKGCSGVIVDDYSEIRVLSGDRNKDSVALDDAGAGSDGYEVCSDGYEVGSGGYEVGSDGYEAGSDGYEVGSDGYEAGRDGYEAGRDGYEAGSGGYEVGSDGYEVGGGAQKDYAHACSSVCRISDSCKYFSVLAAGGDAHGVTIRNAKYNITDADIISDFPLGVSNEVPKGNIAEVSVKQGRLFVIEVFGE